jgi:hypothetical protein
MRAEVRRRILSRCNWTTEATRESGCVLMEEEEDVVEASGGDSGRVGGALEGIGDTVGGERGVDVERPTGVRGVGRGVSTGRPVTRGGLSERKLSAAARLLNTANSTRAKLSSERGN